MPFAFTGTIDKLTFVLEPPKLRAEDEKRLMEATQGQRPVAARIGTGSPERLGSERRSGEEE